MKSLNECITITEKCKKFRKVINIVEGFEVISFDYQDGTDFIDFAEHDAFELRGLSFVEGKRFPMLDKFFNLGERYENEITEALVKRVKSIQVKDDGSLIGFLVLPNGKVVAKTKLGFKNEFTNIANKWLLENDNEHKIVELYNKGIFPLFECVSDKHKVVLSYDWEGLKLIQARTEKNTFLEVDELATIANDYNWTFEDPLEHSLEELLSLKDTLENVEGFIIRFEDDSFCKVKTSWYFELHSASEALDRLTEVLNSVFEGNKIELDDFEIDFIKNVKDMILTPFNIASVLELKSWMFKEEDPTEVEKYRVLYKGYLRDYSLNNNYENENTLIKLTLDNRIDDILPLLNESQRDKALRVQTKTISFLNKSSQEVIEALNENVETKDINSKFGHLQFKHLVFKFAKRDWSDDDIVLDIVEYILKNTKKKQNALAFLSKIN